MRGLPSNRPLTIRQVAIHWGKSVQVTRRELVKIHSALRRAGQPGILLFDGGRPGSHKRVRSLEDLRRCPEFGEHFGRSVVAPPDADTLRNDVDSLKRELRAAQARIRELERVADVTLGAVSRALGLADVGLPMRADQTPMPVESHPDPWGHDLDEVMGEEMARTGASSPRLGSAD